MEHTKHPYSAAIQQWLDTLDADITEINFRKVPYVSFEIGCIYSNSEQLDDFCFDLTRFTKVTTVICPDKELYYSYYPIEMRCMVVLNLKFSPDAHLEKYYNFDLLLNVQFLQLDKWQIFKNKPEYDLKMAQHIRNTINNIPTSVTTLAVHSLWWGYDVDLFPFNNVTEIDVLNGICYNYEKFKNKGITVYPHSDRTPTTCHGVFSCYDTEKFINGVLQNTLLRLEYENDLLQKGHDLLKKEVAELKAMLAAGAAADKGAITSTIDPAPLSDTTTPLEKND